MLSLYYHIIYYPLLNLLVFFYDILPGHSIGLVIILLTVLIRLLMWPSFQKSLKSQREMTLLQPKLNEVREKYKDDKEAQAKAMMNLYKEHKINPLSSCLPLLIQLPILIALYQVFRIALGGHELVGLYSFVRNPGYINPIFLKIINLSKPNYYLAILAGLAQYFQSKSLMPPASQNQDPTAKILQMQTVYLLPILSIVIAWRLPAGLPVYWIITTLFAVLQQYYIKKKYPQPAVSGK